MTQMILTNFSLGYARRLARMPLTGLSKLSGKQMTGRYCRQLKDVAARYLSNEAPYRLGLPVMHRRERYGGTWTSQTQSPWAIFQHWLNVWAIRVFARPNRRPPGSAVF